MQGTEKSELRASMVKIKASISSRLEQETYIVDQIVRLIEDEHFHQVFSYIWLFVMS